SLNSCTVFFCSLFIDPSRHEARSAAFFRIDHLNSERPTTGVLFIDGNKNQRSIWADQLKRCSPDYEIIEVDDGQSGLNHYRSRRIDCVVLELSLPDQSGFQHSSN